MTSHITSTRRVGAAAIAGILLLASAMVPAMAEPAPSDGMECTTADYEAATCLWFAASSDEDPLTEGIARAIESGDQDIADEFIENYADANGLSERESSELKDRAESASEAPGEPSPASSISGDRASTASGQYQTYSGGKTSGFTNIIKDVVSYGACGTGSCTIVGKTQVDFRYEIEGVADFSLVADIDVIKGAGIKITDARCRTRYNNGALPDITVHTWSNCPYWGESDNYRTRFWVQLENWSGGSRGKIYHSDYKLTFHVKGGPNITKAWRGHDYKIRESGSGRAYWV